MQSINGYPRLTCTGNGGVWSAMAVVPHRNLLAHSVALKPVTSRHVSLEFQGQMKLPKQCRVSSAAGSVFAVTGDDGLRGGRCPAKFHDSVTTVDVYLERKKR
ncbi:hypothetical protein BaRGS_00038732 [Batillaria attramentaria]|uniref:Uncharacterized protein n=1 Tax=Batillaria attramentaria TaxID=370345 RepID=A0ABD0J5A7_9CAEN